MLNIIALIPAYSPAKSLIDLVKELKENNIKCVVVNDGSANEYEYIFDELKETVTVLEHDINKGKGATLKTGFKYIKDNEDSCVIVSVDADGQHLVSDVIKVAKYANGHRDSLILGVRSFKKNDVPFKSYYGNKITEFIFKAFTNTHVTDTQTGLRAFDYSLLDLMLEVNGDRYEYEMNQLLACIDKQVPIKELEITTVYENNNASSHFHAFRDSYLIYKQILKYKVSSSSKKTINA